MLERREEDLSADDESTANNVFQSEASQRETANEISNGVETKAVPLSVFDKTLEASPSDQSNPIRGRRRARLRRAVMPALLSIVALGVALAITYAVVGRGRFVGHIPHTSTQPIVRAKGGGVA